MPYSIKDYSWTFEDFSIESFCCLVCMIKLLNYLIFDISRSSPSSWSSEDASGSAFFWGICFIYYIISNNRHFLLRMGPYSYSAFPSSTNFLSFPPLLSALYFLLCLYLLLSAIISSYYSWATRNIEIAKQISLPIFSQSSFINSTVFILFTS